MRRLSSLLLILAVAGCSSTPPSSAESSRRTSPAPTAAASAPAAPALPPPDPREAALAKTVTELLEEEHLLRKKLDDTISREAFDTYLERLDPTKMFLLEADHDALVQYADKIDDAMHSGSLSLAHEGAKRYAARVAVVEKVVAELLSQPMNHQDEEFVEIDPDKVQLATTEDELRDRWRRRLELEVLERVGAMEARLEPPKESKDPRYPKDKAKPLKHKAPDKTDKATPDDEDPTATPLAQIPKTPEGREQKAREDLAKSYAGRFARLKAPAQLDAAAELANAVTSTLDPHTTYMPPADKANFDIHMSGSLEGIGAVLRERDHYIEIVELVPGGAAWRQGGLSPGDVILAVAAPGKEAIDTLDMRIDDVVKMIRGPKNTVVTLRVQKPTGTQETISITRDVVVIEEAYARGALLTPKKGGPTYGYIHVPSFYGGQGKGKRSASADVEKILKDLAARKVAGVILDLRSNGGGILGDAIEMTGHLIDQGPVVQVQDSRGRRETHEDDDKGFDYDGPVVVMVDRFSASASEIVAGALQDYGRAIIVGTGPTHGKGTVQTLADLDRATGGKIELGVLKITIQQFFRVSGASTQGEGVKPDVLLPDPAGHIDTGERELDHAIPWSQIPPAKYTKWGATWNAPALAQKSAARVAKHPVLAKIATTTGVLRARQQDTRVPLAHAAWQKRRDDLKTALEVASPDLTKAPATLNVVALTNGDTATAPGPGGKTDDRPAKWRDSLARDPWVEESVNILADMK